MKEKALDTTCAELALEMAMDLPQDKLYNGNHNFVPSSPNSSQNYK
jgi:hypothetical protein